MNTGRRLSQIVGRIFLIAAVAVAAGCSDLFLHEEFEKRVKHKSEEEVTRAIGKPAAVDASDPTRVTWIYHGKTINIDNQNKLDSKTTLIFEPEPSTNRLRVIDIQYEPS